MTNEEILLKAIEGCGCKVDLVWCSACTNAFVREAATQGQVVGIEQAKVVALEFEARHKGSVEHYRSDSTDRGVQERFQRIRDIASAKETTAYAIRCEIEQLSPLPDYLNRVRNEAATATVAKYFCGEHQKLFSESQVEKFVCFWCAQNKIAEREAEAATAAPEQAAQWRPIQSAPKDGRAILVGRERNSPQSVRWMISVDKQSPGGWWFVGGYDGHRLRWEPSHWMPLPQPPIAAIGDDRE